MVENNLPKTVEFKFSTKNGRFYSFDQKRTQTVSNSKMRQIFRHKLFSTEAYFRLKPCAGKTVVSCRIYAVENKFIFDRVFSTTNGRFYYFRPFIVERVYIRPQAFEIIRFRSKKAVEK